MAKSLDVTETKTPDDVYKMHLVEQHPAGIVPASTQAQGGPKFDSARANLAASFVSAFVNCAHGQDTLIDQQGLLTRVLTSRARPQQPLCHFGLLTAALPSRAVCRHRLGPSQQGRRPVVGSRRARRHSPVGRQQRRQPARQVSLCVGPYEGRRPACARSASPRGRRG